MKKIIIIIVIVVLIILLFKNFTTTKYSHEDIVALIKKGMQTMDSMNNLSYDKEDENGIVHYYFKGDKKKMVSEDLVVINTEEKNYMISKSRKTMVVNNSKSLMKGNLQYNALFIDRYNNNDKYTNKDKFRYEFVFIRNEKIENKNCIFVKECEYHIDTKKYVDYSYNPKGDVPVYWIEKSTGFVIGGALMEAGDNKAVPQTIIRNINFGKIADDMFQDMLTLPLDYNVIEEK